MNLSGLRVLVACEFSGTVRDAFAALGADATSCDLLPSDTPGKHYQGHIESLLTDNHCWDLLIAHPPCTYMTNSGVCWLHRDSSRWSKLDDAARFFMLLYNADIRSIAIENPIMHKYARERIGGMSPSQIIQPWMFGHTEKKATCLWLKNLPPLVPTSNLRKQTDALPMKQQQRLHYLSPSKQRWKLRSKTFDGIAKAMAEQWGSYCMEKRT